MGSIRYDMAETCEYCFQYIAFKYEHSYGWYCIYCKPERIQKLPGLDKMVHVSEIDNDCNYTESEKENLKRIKERK